MKVFPLRLDQRLYVIGDSNTQGYLLYDAQNQRWTKLVCNAKGCLDWNAGDVGAGVQSTTNKIYQFNTIANYAPEYPIIYIVLGTNDAIQDSATVTVDGFYNEYRAEISRLINEQGYAPERIVLVNINWTSGYADRPMLSQAPITLRNEKILLVAKEFNTVHIDMYSHFASKSEADKAASFPDRVHMSISAHQEFANKILNEDYTQINNKIIPAVGEYRPTLRFAA